MTPLHTAAELADAESVRLLLQAGANPHTVDRFGRKAIELLPEQASQELRHMLEAAMARPACAAKP
jgi:ankyrin repeat protein